LCGGECVRGLLRGAVGTMRRSLDRLGLPAHELQRLRDEKRNGTMRKGRKSIGASPHCVAVHADGRVIIMSALHGSEGAQSPQLGCWTQLCKLTYELPFTLVGSTSGR
jgi:hypothetical protein